MVISHVFNKSFHGILLHFTGYTTAVSVTVTAIVFSVKTPNNPHDRIMILALQFSQGGNEAHLLISSEQ